MKVLLTGATGMVGQLVMKHCLGDNKITEVVSLVRRKSGRSDPKLSEIIVDKFEDYSPHTSSFKDVNAAFFCLGAYTGQVKDDLFKKITVNYAVECARMLATNSSGARFCLLSGQGADRTEKSRASFAKYKGMAENQITELDLKFHSFRPAYIYPVEPRKEPNFAYTAFRFIYPLVKVLSKNMSITSEELAAAMFQVGMQSADKEILENSDILALLD